MKKLVLTLTMILGITFCSLAQGGLFGYGAVSDEDYYGITNRQNPSVLNLPATHGDYLDAPADPAPLGSGALLLIGFGAAYALKKRRNRLNHIPPMP